MYLQYLAYPDSLSEPGYEIHGIDFVVLCLPSLSPVSLPRLVDFDWRVDVKISSDSVARMAQPTCLVQMKVSVRSAR